MRSGTLGENLSEREGRDEAMLPLPVRRSNRCDLYATLFSSTASTRRCQRFYLLANIEKLRADRSTNGLFRSTTRLSFSRPAPCTEERAMVSLVVERVSQEKGVTIPSCLKRWLDAASLV